MSSLHFQRSRSFTKDELGFPSARIPEYKPRRAKSTVRYAPTHRLFRKTYSVSTNSRSIADDAAAMCTGVLHPRRTASQFGRMQSPAIALKQNVNFPNPPSRSRATCSDYSSIGNREGDDCALQTDLNITDSLEGGKVGARENASESASQDGSQDARQRESEAACSVTPDDVSDASNETNTNTAPIVSGAGSGTGPSGGLNGSSYKKNASLARPVGSPLSLMGPAPFQARYSPGALVQFHHAPQARRTTELRQSVMVSRGRQSSSAVTLARDNSCQSEPYQVQNLGMGASSRTHLMRPSYSLPQSPRVDIAFAPELQRYVGWAKQESSTSMYAKDVGCRTHQQRGTVACASATHGYKYDADEPFEF